MILFDFDFTIAESRELLLKKYNQIAPFLQIKSVQADQIQYYFNLEPKQVLKELKIWIKILKK